MLPQLVLAPQAVSPAMAADVCGGSSCTPGSASANDWSAEGLLFALARAEELQLRPNVWIAVNPTEELAATHPQHTLGARLGISSLHASGVPAQGAAAERARRGEAARRHAAALRLKVEQVETFIKRGMPQHMPSCADAEPAAGVPTCPEHCRACAFGCSNSDGSRPAACSRTRPAEA